MFIKALGMDICQICVSPFTKCLRSPVKCIFCDFEACKQCVQTFIQTLSVEDPYCMNPACKAVWNRQFLVDNLPKMWINDAYVRHRENVILDRERSLIPATMVDVEDVKRADQHRSDVSKGWAMKKEAIRMHGVLLEELEAQLRTTYTEADTNEKTKNISRPGFFCACCESYMDAQTAIARGHIDNDSLRSFKFKRNYPNGESMQICSTPTPALVPLIERVVEAEMNVVRLRSSYSALRHRPIEKVKSTVTVSKPCPVTDCRGFLSRCVCAVCGTNVCKACETIVIKDDEKEHVCDPALVESVTMISKDSKCCPSCRALIFRVSGCDQMWCTLCHVSFSWNSGLIISHGIVHNPHYFDYMRANGGLDCLGVARNPQDVVCGGFPTMSALLGMRLLKRHEVIVETIYRDINQFQDYIVRSVRATQAEGPPYYREKRLMYILGKLTEKHWKVLIQRKDKFLEKNSNLLQNCDMLIAVCIDIFNKLLQDNAAIVVCLKEFDLIKSMYNENVDKINKVYDSKNKSYHLSGKVWGN
jgi:hypothetical protein